MSDKAPRICHAMEPRGRGRCGLYAAHPGPHRLLRADHPKDEARAYQRVEWTNGYRYRAGMPKATEEDR